MANTHVELENPETTGYKAINDVATRILDLDASLKNLLDLAKSCSNNGGTLANLDTNPVFALGTGKGAVVFPKLESLVSNIADLRQNAVDLFQG